MSVAAEDVTSVAGDQAGQHTVTVAAGSAAPTVGGYLVAPISPEAPRGVLGRVTGVVTNPDGSTTVTLVPARLDEAFDQVNIATTKTLDDATITPGEGAPAAGPSARSFGKEFGVSASLGMLSCNTNLAAKVEYALSLKDLNLDFELNTVARRMKMVATYSPQFTAELKASGAVSCSLTELVKPRVWIPVSAMPPLGVEIKPEFNASLEGSFSASVAWGPTIQAGFTVDSSGVTPIGSASCCGDINTGTFSASAEAFMGLSGGLSVAGLASGGFDFGPKLTWKPTNSCSSIDIGLALNAKLDTIVDGWNIHLNAAVLPLGEISKECTDTPAAGYLLTCEPSGDGLLLRFPDLGPTYIYNLVLMDGRPLSFTSEFLDRNGAELQYRLTSENLWTIPQSGPVQSTGLLMNAYNNGTSVLLGAYEVEKTSGGHWTCKPATVTP
ncbi:hypothetical protein [Prescottella agglutinans]|uniref:Uncharacterized protein n=1 Tax=Prescottella agglutinans TaxID=1644129 RepID=A0ABT6MKR4_9NOCA|nr:hypothetical protein [Prescottella agglutinans]MDH6284815.1 hypothetical protein [Prescottella agglutinans]